MAHSRIPSELFLATLDHACFSTLLATSHVSRHWRTAAHLHPRFWRRIRIAAASPTAVDCFIFRLGLRSSDSVLLDLSLARFHDPVDVWICQILAAVESNIHRAESVKFFLAPQLAPVILRALSQPAPILQYFCLSFEEPHPEGNIDLPVNLFDRQCPCLTFVYTKNIMYPLEPIPAFASVVEAIYEHTPEVDLPFPEPVLQIGPKIRKVVLMYKRLPCPPAASMTRVLSAIRRLENILFPKGPGQVELIAALNDALKRVPTVMLFPPTLQAGSMIMAHLGTVPLSFEMEYNEPPDGIPRPDLVYTFIADVSESRLSRSFWDFSPKFNGYDHARRAGFYFDPMYTNRIETMTIDQKAWALFGLYVRELPVCATLTIKLDDTQAGSFLSEESDQAVTFPCLRSLILVAPMAFFRPSYARGFTVSFIKGYPDTCELYLRPFGVDGPAFDRMSRLLEVGLPR